MARLKGPCGWPLSQTQGNDLMRVEARMRRSSEVEELCNEIYRAMLIEAVMTMGEFCSSAFGSEFAPHMD